MVCMKCISQASNDLCTLEDIERVSSDWHPYSRLFEDKIIPLVADLADALLPLLASGLQAISRRAHVSANVTPGAQGAVIDGMLASHFELFACDLIVTDDGHVSLMEVNVNPAFGVFTERTEELLVRPMFQDLLTLCALPAAGLPSYAGRFRRVRAAGFGTSATMSATHNDAFSELQAHQVFDTNFLRARPMPPSRVHSILSLPDFCTLNS